MNPKISICIPAYKAPGYLRKTLQSVFIQTFLDYEVIITDDSPDDSIRNVVRDFLPDKRIKYHKNPEKKGSPENWNRAISLAKGKYIKILHHDDWFSDKECLQKFSEMLDRNPDADFAFSATRVCNSRQEFICTHHASKKQIRRLVANPVSLFGENIIGAPSATILRNRHAVTFDPHLKWVVDIDFYISVLMNNGNFIFTNDALISTTSGAPHQVTQECKGNKQIQLYEWIYLYRKVRPFGDIGLRGRKLLWNLLEQYEVRSSDDLLKVGIEPPFPSLLKLFIMMQALMYPFSKLRPC